MNLVAVLHKRVRHDIGTAAKMLVNANYNNNNNNNSIGSTHTVNLTE